MDHGRRLCRCQVRMFGRRGAKGVAEARSSLSTHQDPTMARAPRVYCPTTGRPCRRFGPYERTGCKFILPFGSSVRNKDGIDLS